MGVSCALTNGDQESNTLAPELRKLRPKHPFNFLNMELNPNHKVVRQARDHWHKIAALIMVKIGKTELEITLDDINKMAAGNVNIVLDSRGERETGVLRVLIVDDKTAAELARREGGRACDS